MDEAAARHAVEFRYARDDAAAPHGPRRTAFEREGAAAMARSAVGGPASSSTMLFHSWQESQRPCHRLVTAPQFWQTKVERDLAMAFLLAGR